MRRCRFAVVALFVMRLFAFAQTTAGDGSGALIATLHRAFATNDFYFGGTIGPNFWTTNRSFSLLDFSATFGTAPGANGTWTLSAEYASLPSNQSCADITVWTAVQLCKISGTQKSCNANDVPINVVGPACVRGHAVLVGATNTSVGGGQAALYPKDTTDNGPVHFQGSGGGANPGVFYGGSVIRSANTNRAYWISPGVSLQSVGGVVAFTGSPVPGDTWHIQVVSSKTSLTPGQACTDLSYNTTGDVCTITGGGQKACHWPPAPINVPASGCVQVRGTCTGASCASDSVTLNNLGLDLSKSATSPYDSGGPSYGNGGSGAFNAGHAFGIGPWAISDAQPVNGTPTLEQQFWQAPATGLNACSGGFIFESPTTGTGQFSVGVTTSTTAPGPNQSCLDLSYVDSTALCGMKAGDKSCTFSLTSISIPPHACFALNIKASGGTPSNTSPFNWQASCTVGSNTTPPPTDTSPPSIPTSVAVQTVSDSQLDLSWIASTDNVGVVSYVVYRSSGGSAFAPVATVSSTFYQDAGLTAQTTYSYTVSAFDAAGNTSAQSVPVSATTNSSTIPPGRRKRPNK